MSIELLPPGTDVLAARAAEMAHNLRHGGRAVLSRGEVSASKSSPGAPRIQGFPGSREKPLAEPSGE